MNLNIVTKTAATEMLGIEGDSFNEDALFGSGPGTWNQSTEVDLRLRDREARLGTNPEMVHPRFSSQGTENNPVREINLRSEPCSTNLSSSQHRTDCNNIQPAPQPQLNITMEPRDPGVRNKTTKNKENKNKNVNQRRQITETNEMDCRSREPAETGAASLWEPVLQVKKHNREPADRKSKNSIKDKKQSKNSSIAQGRTEDQCMVNSCDASSSMLISNGINPVEHPRNISTIYVKHQPNEHSPTPILDDHIDPNDFSLASIDSMNESNGETGRKVVEGRENIPHIHNDLWGRKKSNTSNNILPSLDLSLSSMQNDLDTDTAPNRSPSVVQVSGVSVGQGNCRNNPARAHNPIVVPFVTEHNMQYNNGQVNPPVSLHNNSLTLSMDGVGQSPGILPDNSMLEGYTSCLPSDLPSSLFFGAGNDDFLYAQKVQRELDREHIHQLRLEEAEEGLDIGPDQLYYNTDSLQNEQHTPEPEEPYPEHTVSIERQFNDLYNPGETEHDDVPIQVPVGFQSPREQNDDSVAEYIHLPQPDYLVPHDLGENLQLHEDPYLDHNLAGPALQDTEGGGHDYGVQERGNQARQLEDEEFARKLQEQLILAEDEEYARYLQDIEETGRRRDRYRSHREPTTHQPLHSRVGHVWNRPLRVGVNDAGQNVMDSRLQGRGTWDRPLQRQTARYGGNQFAFLDNIRDLPEREGYDIPPGGDPFYRYEYDPDNMLDESGEYQVSINRDPRMLASLLMVRAPGMMVPNDIDLNDYEALWDLAEGLGEVRRVGMEQEEISLLPVHTFQATANTDSENSKTDCLVCLNTFAKGEQLRTLPCCHIYHVDCIDEWLKRNAICPVCRQSAKQGEH